MGLCDGKFGLDSPMAIVWGVGEMGLISEKAQCVRGDEFSLPQSPMCEEIVDVVPHQLQKGLVASLLV